MIISRTPLRISFVGGGSDLKSFYDKKDGKVISTAIDKYVYAIVKERFDDLIYINYSNKETVEKVDDIKHDLVREAMKKANVTKGVEITTLADIPSSGSGLGSSSSITIALLHALHTYKNRLVTAKQLAEEACEIEIDILKKPIGRQDQYGAAFGGINQFTFKKGDITQRKKIDISPSDKRLLEDQMMLFFTGITRSADKILAKQNNNMKKEDKFSTLSKMVDLVDPFTTAFKNADIDEVSNLLNLNWEMKKGLASGISNPEIDEMYENAIKSGALAGKITGAGGGGFMLLFTPEKARTKIREKLKNYREIPFMIEQGGSKIIFEHRNYSAK